jgi:hypothetical protein
MPLSPSLSLALMHEFERERVNAARRARHRSPRTLRLRAAARSRRAAARPAVDCG